MTKPQIIIDDGGKPAFAVIPWQEYTRLAMMDADAGLTDEELYDQAKSVGGESFLLSRWRIAFWRGRKPSGCTVTIAA